MKIGIIVGRFQLPVIHSGHRRFIGIAKNENDKIIVVIGKSIVQTNKNPLPVDYIRKQFANEGIKTLILSDTKYDETWDNSLDSLIQDNINTDDIVTLYGSRDSFLKTYKGKYEGRIVDDFGEISATKIRQNICGEEITESTAKGIIQSYNYRYPVAYPTVDIAIVDEYRQEVLMAKKENEKGYRFIGGFVDPSDMSIEAAVARELQEETGIIADNNLTYIGSAKINDWRYAGTQDGIITSFFKCNIPKDKYNPIAQDDIIALNWMRINEIMEDVIEKEHRQLFNILKRRI